MFHIAGGIILAFLFLEAVKSNRGQENADWNAELARHRIKAELREERRRQIAADAADAARRRQENADWNAELARRGELKRIAAAERDAARNAKFKAPIPRKNDYDLSYW